MRTRAAEAVGPLPAASALRFEGDDRVNPEWDDRKLVSAYLRKREERAFRALYQRHNPLLHRVILRLVRGRPSEAEDILQATWIRAAERLDTFRWDSALRSWLTGIAINCYREAYRREARKAAEPLELHEFPVARRLHREIPRIDLERAIAQLPDGYREVLILHDIEGYTHDEIGNLMGIRNGTSKSQLSRARRAVRVWLERPEKEEVDERRAS